MSPCNDCRDPGRCCRAFTYSSIAFPIDADRDEVRRHLRAGTNRPSWAPPRRPVPFEPLVPSGFWCRRGERKPSGVTWLVSCPELDDAGRCGIYDDRPDCCVNYEPKSSPLCAEFDGPWRGQMGHYAKEE